MFIVVAGDCNCLEEVTQKSGDPLIILKYLNECNFVLESKLHELNPEALKFDGDRFKAAWQLDCLPSKKDFLGVLLQHCMEAQASINQWSVKFGFKPNLLSLGLELGWALVSRKMDHQILGESVNAAREFCATATRMNANVVVTDDLLRTFL